MAPRLVSDTQSWCSRLRHCLGGIGVRPGAKERERLTSVRGAGRVGEPHQVEQRERIEKSLGSGFSLERLVPLPLLVFLNSWEDLDLLDSPPGPWPSLGPHQSPVLTLHTADQ